ncbi:hypothetical protein QQF64_034763 [Cirrhinus molitorella]|uniref:Secreted protein n=1 Tax=Cirrhinus molitorella TaxID=172907 RepID=A0ABR3L530_9TELE
MLRGKWAGTFCELIGVLYQSERFLLPSFPALSLHPSTSSLAVCTVCTHRGREKCGAGDSEDRKKPHKKTEAASGFSFTFFSHSRRIITKEQAPPAYKNLRCVCAQTYSRTRTSRRINSQQQLA